MSRSTIVGLQTKADHTDVKVTRKREPLLPRGTQEGKPIDYKAEAENVLSRFPVTMEYLGR